MGLKGFVAESNPVRHPATTVEVVLRAYMMEDGKQLAHYSVFLLVLLISNIS